MTAQATQTDPEIGARQRRLRILARTDRATLEAALAALPAPPAWRRLKQPETGLAMVRGRAGGVGQRFNLGEMTVSRCVVTLESDGKMGVGYVQGRDRRRAELVAVFDALSQDADGAEKIEQLLIAPVEQKLATERATRAAKVAATKVDFFTLVRGED
ncbi:phosphonate C-P lyase system protein PhnG [Ferrovibrio terrae]|uniref:Phosphonate C-P lyase system protein PhnG n=1 Tax=Ferrovibrio terrae TaxID=2594003 RepID=A0A516H121_9PROT|nr:phosphonate C-P lyase system protein PhnG [Ferrovibrio terrae]QDO97493.1 phosphonate C-P lyase system protein PhnG [Ferrovibrio terrae]